MKLSTKENIYGYIFISPWLIGFTLLSIGPMIMSLLYSFTDYDYFRPLKFIGLDNYSQIIIHDELFHKALSVTLKYVLWYVPLRVGLALIVAVLLNQQIRGMSFYRTIYYMPSILGSGVAVSVMWRVLLSKDGAFNALLSLIGVEGPNWLANPRTAPFAIVLMSCWAFGSAMVIFLAGLKGIPTELYEASSVDGATPIRQFFSITLPLLSPVIFFNVVMSIINTFQVFTQAFIMTNGGPLNSTRFYVLYLYQNAFQYFRMGYASALAWILFCIIMIFTLLVFRSSAFWVHYQSM
ncbi:MAG: sugar ABC transporter permease [Firmicutes bacterium]|nr:sugar ABC transporter permease [Bacillota bacterium]